MQLFKRNVSPHELILFAVEIVLICGAMAIAVHLHGSRDASWPWRILPAAALCQLCLYYNDFYDLTLVQSGRDLLARLVQAAGAASIILGVLYLVVPFIAVQGQPFRAVAGDPAGRDPGRARPVQPGGARLAAGRSGARSSAPAWRRARSPAC